MTREKIKKLLPILEAYANGKVIQFYCRNSEPHWQDVQSDDLIAFSEDATRYRIKPELKYRPFSNPKECWEEMQKHHPFGWIKNKLEDWPTYLQLPIINNNNNFELEFKEYTFVDGTPFGVKE